VQFAVLGSGSRGNATVIRCGKTLLLVDNGFSGKELERRLANVGLLASELDGILVTHEHGDHIAGVGVVSRRHKIPVWMTAGTATSNTLGIVHQLNIIETLVVFSIGEVVVTAVPVMHDAKQPCQFVFQHEAIQLGLLTDLGSIDTTVIDAYQYCTSLIFEANYADDLLARGPYPPSLKQRVGGQYGHLSNRQSAQYLSLHQSRHPGVLKTLVMAHVSEKNNNLAAVKAAIEPILLPTVNCHYAQQGEVLGFINAQ
jgi:phosphoribosyl 1,2-cyclic phosphodiesterase